MGTGLVKRGLLPVFTGAISALLPIVFADAVAQTIGNTVAVVPAAEGTLGGSTRQLTVGDGVSQNERIRTAPSGSTRLKFRDDTVLNVGPNATVTLDRFVYNPDSSASASVMTATRGAFRFATGKSDKSAYQINTPTATIGVRGTVIDFIVTINGVQVRVISGQAFVCRRGVDVASEAARRRGCRSINPEDGVILVSQQNFAPVSGDIINVMDEVHRNLNITSGLSLADPGGSGGGLGGGFSGPGLPGDPGGLGGGFAPPASAPLAPPPVFGPPPAGGFTTAPNDPLVFYRWTYYPGYPSGPGIFTVGGYGPASYDSIFGSPVVKAMPWLRRQVGTPGAAGLFEGFGNPALIMGRWADGTIVNNDPIGVPPTIDLSANDGIHFIVGRQTTESEFGLPAGTAGPVDLTYNLLHATKPTSSISFGGGSPGIGTLDAPPSRPPGTFEGTMKVRMLPTIAHIALEATLTMPPLGGGAPTIYTMKTHGGLANPSASTVTINLPSDGNVVFEAFFSSVVVNKPSHAGGCSSFCFGSFTGYFFGSSYQFLGLHYYIFDSNYGFDDPAEKFNGVAAFQRAGGPAAGSGDIVLPTQRLVVEGIGNLSQLIPEADLMWLDPSHNLYKAGKTGGPVLDRVSARQMEKGRFGGTSAAPVIAFERWAQGFVAGSINNQFNENTGVHLVWGQPATALPTSGTFSYELQGATRPTIQDGSLEPGTFTGSMAVQFGTKAKVGVDFNVGIGGHTYNVKSAGGATNPSTSQINLSPTGTFAVGALPVTPGGPACPGSNCSANVRGFLAGPGGIFAGVGYAIGSPTGSGSKVVSGGAVFKRGGGGG